MINIIYILILLFILINIFIGFLLIKKKLDISNKRKLKIKIKEEINQVITSKKNIKQTLYLQKYPLLSFDVYQEIITRLKIPPKINSEFIGYFITIKKIKKQSKLLKSKNVFKRCKAATYLSYIGNNDIILNLENRLQIEKNIVVKKYIIQALSRIGNETSIDLIINSATNWNEEFINWVAEIIINFTSYKKHDFSKLMNSENNIITYLLLRISGLSPHKQLKNYLENYISNKKNEYRSIAVDSLIKLYPQELELIDFINDEDPLVRKQSLYLLTYFPNKKSIYRVTQYISENELKDSALKVLDIILKKNPNLYSELLNILLKEKNIEIRDQLACILSQQSEYYLSQFLNDKEGLYHRAIKVFIVSGFSSKIIEFLNNNNNLLLEDEIINFIKPLIINNSKIILPYQKGLNRNLKDKLSIPNEIKINKREHVEKSRAKILTFMLLFSIIILPFTYYIKNNENIKDFDFIYHLKGFILHFDYFFSFYTIAVNISYITILLFAFRGMIIQNRFWSIKRRDHLFSQNALPSISIIAPAYNEEATIIENIHSLLTLDYPDFEVIVVNDGSPDSTLETIKNHFNLVKIDVLINEELDTMPIRGVYKNPELPLLTVIDKQNGGKADSLNLGINFSTKEFICGIDADSLLEGDSLVKLVSPKIDTIKDSIAFGGNIIPVNGCKIDHGKLEEIHIPKGFLERIQSVEYIRSYMAGRLGWATINSLLIISGAFGLFKRQLVIDVGGYLTAQGVFHKDTVGEDMELVVRIVKYLEEQKKKYKVHFSYNANCWTEVPSNLNIFNKQRNRWQRGLIDIIIYHGKMLLNPKYGIAGTVAFPYFLTFEIIGPILEFQGYLFFVTSILLGLISPLLILLLFFGTVMLGITVSLSSLLMTEYNEDNFSKKDLFLLIIIAIIENFGIRQLISLYRNIGFLSSFKRSKGWGNMIRKGFKSQQ